MGQPQHEVPAWHRVRLFGACVCACVPGQPRRVFEGRGGCWTGVLEQSEMLLAGRLRHVCVLGFRATRLLWEGRAE